MTLDTETMRARAEALADLHRRWDVGAVSCVRVCNAAPAVAADVLALLAELARVTAERDALRQQVIELTPRPRQPYPTDGKAYRSEGNPGPAPYFNGSEPE